MLGRRRNLVVAHLSFSDGRLRLRCVQFHRALYRQLIAVRRRLPVLSLGDYRGLQGEGDLLAYLREHQGQRVAIVLNLGIESLRFELPGSGQVLLSTNLDREAERSRTSNLNS